MKTSRAKHEKQPKEQFSVRELGSETWPDFVRVVEKHNGIWGGCWCVAYHLKRSEEKEWSGKHRELKEELVRENRTHSALIYDGLDTLAGASSDPPQSFPPEWADSSG